MKKMKLSRDLGVAVLVVLGAACGSAPDAANVAAGSGTAGSGAAAPSVREYTVPEGATLSLKLSTAIDSGTNVVEDLVEATLAQAVLVDGAEVLPAGSTVRGLVSAVKGSAKVKGLASMTLQFTTVAAAGRSDHYDIDATWSETAKSTKGADAEKIGIGAGAGAVIGAVLGGKGGALKGAAVGGGAGTAVVLSTKGKDVEHPVGTILTVTLRKSIDVRVPTR